MTIDRRQGHQVTTGAPPVTAGPISRRPLLGRPAVQGALAAAIYIIGWLSTVARPMVTHLGWARLYQRSMDPNFYVWSLRWWPYAVSHGLNPLFTHQIGAPAGYSLAWVTTVPPLGLAATPLTLVAGPVRAYNLLAALALPLSAWAAFVLCRRLTGKFWPALAGGAIFGFSAYETGHALAGQLNLIYALLLPLLAYLVVVWRDRAISDTLFVVLGGLIMATQFYLFLETFAGMTAVVTVSLLLGVALAGRAGRPRMLRLTGLTAMAYAVAIVLAAPYLVFALSGQEPTPILSTSVDLASLVVPRPTRTYGIAWLTHAAKLPTPTAQACYVGVPLLLLVVLVTVTGWSNRLVRFLFALLAVILLAALGPAVNFEGRRIVSLPWHAIWDLPIVRNAYPSRLMLFAYLVLAALTAVWLAGPGLRPAGSRLTDQDPASPDGTSQRPASSDPADARSAGPAGSSPDLAGQAADRRPAGAARWLCWARWPVTVLAVGVLLANTPSLHIQRSSSVPTFISSGQYRHYLSRDEIVVVISNVGNAGMLWQADSGFYTRLAGGFVNASIVADAQLPLPVQHLDHVNQAAVAAFEAYVKADHIGAILLDPRHEPYWGGVFARVGLVGHRYGQVILYPIDDCRTCHALK